MDIGAYLAAVATNYDRQGGLHGYAQDLLRKAQQHLQHHAPAGYIVIGSGGKGTATFTPWFGFFDPDETSSPEEGLYVAYLFAADLSRVSLTVMQGITTLDRTLGRRQARDRLARDAAVIRSRMEASDLGELNTAITLGSSGFRQRAYEAGCMFAETYETSRLPAELTLRHDLDRFMALHQAAVGVKRELLQASPGVVASASSEQLASAEDPLRNFKPKDEADYVAHLAGRTLVKTRRHERLIRQYGEWLQDTGFSLSTAEHPKDLVVRTDADEWLIEAKVVKLGRAMDAVRDALGQLYGYRHFLYQGSAAPVLAALFSEAVGEAFVRFLELCGVETVWYESGRWLGSPRAVAARLAASPPSG